MHADTAHDAPFAQAARALSVMTATCAFALLAAATGVAVAWLTDEAQRTNAFTLEAVGAIIDEPYAAVYTAPDGSERCLVFDRGEDIPQEWDGMLLEASWRGMERGEGDFPASGTVPWRRYGKIIRIASGDAARRHPIGVLDMQGWFSGMYYLITADVSGITPNTSAEGGRAASTDLSRVFFGCTMMEHLEGVEAWDVTGVTNLRETFYACNELPCLDLSRWDVSSVTELYGTFERCWSLTSLDLSTWDVSLVQNAACLFLSCSSLVEVDITGWHLAICQTLRSMFEGCTALKVIKGMEELSAPQACSNGKMFSGCSSIERIVLGDIHTGTTGSVDSWEELFYGCTSLRYADISRAFLKEPSFGRGMFTQADHLETLIASSTNALLYGPALDGIAESGAGLFAPACWQCEETGQGYDEQSLPLFLQGSFSLSAPRRTFTFHKQIPDRGTNEPYAALYERADGQHLLIMDTGSSAPETYEGMPLVQEIRGIGSAPQQCSDEWRKRKIAGVRILSSFAPTSCARWFADMPVPEGIRGLNLLDMSGCVDVTDMFASSGATVLDVEDWKLPYRPAGYLYLFDTCYNLDRLDVTRWTSVDSLSLAGAYSLSEVRFPRSISIYELCDTVQANATRFFDGYWYRDGTGKPLTSYDVEASFWMMTSKDKEFVFTHERSDRSYAALYGRAENTTLVFGRGMDIPQAFEGLPLITSYRGLEETAFEQRDWMSFHEGACPWREHAGSISSVTCMNETLRTPIQISAISEWFAGCASLTNAYLAGLDLSGISSLRGAFDGCSSLAQIVDAGSWDTSHMTDMNATFRGCSTLILDCSGWNVSNVQDHSSFSEGADHVISPFEERARAEEAEEASEEPTLEPILEAADPKKTIDPDEPAEAPTEGESLAPSVEISDDPSEPREEGVPEAEEGAEKTEVPEEALEL